MKIKMMQDTSEGLLHELNAILPPSWMLHREVNRFLIAPPAPMNEGQDQSIRLRSEVWRIAQFVAYPTFTSIERLANGEYEIKSVREDGTGFVIRVLAVPRDLPDSRPRPFEDE